MSTDQPSVRWVKKRTLELNVGRERCEVRGLKLAMLGNVIRGKGSPLGKGRQVQCGYDCEMCQR